jgi:hypothetical protein
MEEFMMQIFEDNAGFRSPLDHVRAKKLSAVELRQHAQLIRNTHGFGFADVMNDEADAVEVLEMKRFESSQRQKHNVTITMSEENAFDVIDNLKVALRMYNWKALQDLLEQLEDKLVDRALAVIQPPLEFEPTSDHPLDTASLETLPELVDAFESELEEYGRGIFRTTDLTALARAKERLTGVRHG